MKGYIFIKRVMDIALSAVALILLWPLFLVIAAAIKLDSKGPVFFVQQRLGQNGSIFNIYKFRTMVDGAIGMGSGILTDAHDPRITRVGAYLRKTSLDEIPQIINILKGDMSIIGPRPPVPYHPKKYEEYDDTQKIRFRVKPGITGYAQVMVRNSVPWDERILFDIQYVERMGFLFDCFIFFKTIGIVLKGCNIYVDRGAGKQGKKELPALQNDNYAKL